MTKLVDEPYFRKIINYFKDECIRKVKIALEPFMDELDIPIQIIIDIVGKDKKPEEIDSD